MNFPLVVIIWILNNTDPSSSSLMPLASSSSAHMALLLFAMLCISVTGLHSGWSWSMLIIQVEFIIPPSVALYTLAYYCITTVKLCYLQIENYTDLTCPSTTDRDDAIFWHIDIGQYSVDLPGDSGLHFLSTQLLTETSLRVETVKVCNNDHYPSILKNPLINCVYTRCKTWVHAWE